MAVKVTVRLNQAALNRVVGGQVTAATRRAAGRVVKAAQKNVTAAGRVNTGALRDSIQILSVQGPALRPEMTVGTTLFYAMWQEEGRGPVRPRTKQFLRFKPKGSSTFVFTKYAGPAAGAHFMRDAFKRIRVDWWVEP